MKSGACLCVVGRRSLRELAPRYVVALIVIYLAAPPSVTAEELAIVKAAETAETARIRAIEAVYGSVVSIYGNERQGGGSGVLFDPNGYALTNHHVIAGTADGGWAGLADGKLYRWKLVGTDPGGDLAIIQLAGKDEFPYAPIGDSESVRVGDWALAMGNPFALAEDQQPSVSLGIVSGVNRFQEGAGLNQLVYGNCIQVDSSINPGNSGGPLFNLHGQIIGINGRGSFEERGRVNVGLGYAISANQIKQFIPELLAAKIAQHGTLDCVFSNREGGVICATLNLDSPAAKAGLALGDKLIGFEGTPISDANQFTNLIATYPAGWPVKVLVEREGRQKTLHVRLSALPYERLVRASIQQSEKTPPEPKQDKGQKPGPREPSNAKAFPLSDAGKVRDAKLNREMAQRLISQWRASANGGGSSLIESKGEIRRGGQIVGWQILKLASGGQVSAEYEIDGQRTTLLCDGQECSKNSQRIARGKAMLDPHFAQGIALAALVEDDPFARWGALVLDGADKAGNRWCYRLSVTDPATSEQLFIWLSAFDDAGLPRIQLVKTGVGLSDDEPIASTMYEDFRPADGSPIPQRLTLVRGLAEEPMLEIGDAAGATPAGGGTVAPDSTFTAAIQIAQQRTVKIFGAGIGRGAGYASGILVGPNGQILTTQGVFLSAENLRATLPDGQTRTATVVRRSNELQAALLQIDSATPEWFDLSRRPEVTPGDWILAVSNAFKVTEGSERLGVNIGVFSMRTPIDARRGLLHFPYQADAVLYDAITSNPGAEGGAVVTADGQLVGIIGRVIESRSSGTRLNYAVPVDALAKFVAGEGPAASAATPLAPVKADLGIRLFSLGGRRGPAYIDRINPGSPAAAAGLKTDDLIVSIGGHVVRDVSDFRRIVESLRVGVELPVEVKRKNELITVRIAPVEEK